MWRQTRSLTGNTRTTVLEEILCSGDSITATDWFSFLEQSFTVLFHNSKDRDADNDILSSLVAHSPSLARSLSKKFYWHRVDTEGFYRKQPLRNANKQTVEIMKQCGANPCYIQYRLMSLSTEITNWKQYIDKGVDPLVHSWLLMDSIENQLSNKHLAFLISSGANVNYSIKMLDGKIEAPLTMASICEAHKDLEKAMCLLLNHGADILFHINNPKNIKDVELVSNHLWSNVSRDFVKMLENIENKEIARRNVHIVPSAGELLV